jgi:hypothetical protein
VGDWKRLKTQFGVPSVLTDPMLDLRDAQEISFATNDNWADTQHARIQASGFAPPNANESAIIILRSVWQYYRGISCKNNTGSDLVEV